MRLPYCLILSSRFNSHEAKIQQDARRGNVAYAIIARYNTQDLKINEYNLIG